MPPRRKAATKSAATKTTAGATTALAEEQTDPAQLTVPKLKQSLQERGIYIIIVVIIIISFNSSNCVVRVGNDW